MTRSIWSRFFVYPGKGQSSAAISADVLYASPVMIDVETEAGAYQEMHVDGATSAQMFVYPAAIKLEELAAASAAKRAIKLYIIRNARLDPEWAQVERRTLPLATFSSKRLVLSMKADATVRLVPVLTSVWILRVASR